MKINKKLIASIIATAAIIAIVLVVFNVCNNFYINQKVKSGVEGLKLNEIHNQGYTGKGINAAVIDSSILRNHEEFKDCLKYYEEVGYVDKGESHGGEVTSVLCGKYCGAAPECNLHYFAITNISTDAYLKALNRVIKYNASVESSKKIRIVNMSTGPDKGKEKEFRKAMEDANKNGIIVFTSTVPTFTSQPFAIRAAYFEKGKDINDFNNIDIYFDKKRFTKDMTKDKLIKGQEDSDKDKKYSTVYVPSGNRYIPSYKNVHNYVFEKECSDSLSTPYVTGMAVIALQANPKLTNNDILKVLSNSTVKNKNGLYIIYPPKVIENAKKYKI